MSETKEYSGRATYEPESNKLRLYVGRVPREEYLKLRAEGWTALHKQRESGGGDFAAPWTPSRRDTALEYAGIIEDEDMSTEERAADRAERFSGYRDKRTNEATGHADRYDSGPQAHGFQSQARAERAAARHDRVADRAGDAWSKAEYWQQRTAGVISHALYKSTPGVRMGRIKVLEAELRRFEQNPEHYPNWITHTKLRLAYENQMLEAQGGRAAFVEMIPGGFIGLRQIFKVNKSPATGRVVSVLVKGQKIHGYTYKAQDVIGADYSLHQIETERLPADAYRAPTAEELTAFTAARKAEKAARPTKTPCPLINPTDEDAERVQKLWNDRALAEHCESYKRRYGKDYADEFKPSTVCRITQARYSEVSKGGHARAETKNIYGNVIQEPRERFYDYDKQAAERKAIGAVVCQLRITSGDGSDYGAKRVIILTDKPQKPLPVAVWEAAKVAQAEASETITCSACGNENQRSMWEKTSNALFSKAIICPSCDMHHADTNENKTAPTLANA